MIKGRKIICAGIAAALSICIILLNTGFAADAPGGASDPLVTKSYVDDRINQVLALMGNAGTGSQLAEPTMRPDSLNQDLSETARLVMEQLEYLYGFGAGSVPVSDNSFQPVFAFAGQCVIGDEGSEIILRSGQAVGYCPGENGLVNMTTGSEIINGESVSINNLAIVSRGDGRGMMATTDAWFLVRGGYSLYNFNN